MRTSRESFPGALEPRSGSTSASQDLDSEVMLLESARRFCAVGLKSAAARANDGGALPNKQRSFDSTCP
jgi:hypothetical protein